MSRSLAYPSRQPVPRRKNPVLLNAAFFILYNVLSPPLTHLFTSPLPLWKILPFLANQMQIPSWPYLWPLHPTPPLAHRHSLFCNISRHTLLINTHCFCYITYTLVVTHWRPSLTSCLDTLISLIFHYNSLNIDLSHININH